MKSPKTLVILLLAATTVGGALLAWRQYGEIVELRALAMNRDERADLQRRLWELEKANRELQDRLAVQHDPNDPDAMLENAGPRERPSGRGGRGERGGDPRGFANGAAQANAVRELMNKPEVQAMLSLQQKAAIEARYSTLFKNLNLAPDQVEKLKTLLAERTTTVQDVMAAAREQGINPRENPDAFRKLVADAQNVINQGIKSVIGEEGFSQMTNYEQTLPQRNLVNDLQQRLSYTSTPLTPAQAEQMVQVLANNQPQRPQNSANSPSPGDRPPGRGGPPPPDFGGPGFMPRGGDVGGMIAGFLGGPGTGWGGMDGGRGPAVVTSAAVAQSQSVLAPPQVAALQQIQQQQQAQQQLRQLVNDTMVANQPPNPKGAPTGKSSGGTSPGSGRRPGG